MPPTSKKSRQHGSLQVDSVRRLFIQIAGHAIAIAAFLVLCSVVSFPQAPDATAAASEPSSQAEEIRELREAVSRLQAEVVELKRELHGRGVESISAPSLVPAVLQTGQSTPQTAGAETPRQSAASFLNQTVIEIGLDGYYGYNFNNPIGRVNLLRAYDVSSNAFSLNQANLIFKIDPDLAAGRHYGARLDLQYGQATETLQGNRANELRPDVYRPVFQAFGTYVIPAGKGITVDFGKWASALGFENNYSKDQINYSRSLWFNFLPFYHMGVRANYKFNDKFGVNYWIVNGTQQTEPFNGFKDQLLGFNLEPHKTVNWTVNYYLGQEHPDVVFFPNGGAPTNSPTQQGIPFQPIPNAASGKLHILDSYVTWQTTPKLTLALEGDFVIERLLESSPPAHTTGGAAYARFQLHPKVALAARAEYLSDRDGLFTGVTQALKEVTLTYDYKVADRFLLRSEWRRDFSSKQFFLTDRLGILSHQQTTATMGLVWWWGNKEESW